MASNRHKKCRAMENVIKDGEVSSVIVGRRYLLRSDPKRFGLNLTPSFYTGKKMASEVLGVVSLLLCESV